MTSENTIDNDVLHSSYKVNDPDHRNYDAYMENVCAGTIFKAISHGVSSAKRRQDTRLGVSRVPLLDMTGSGRELFYQQRLLMNLPWYCTEPVQQITINNKDCFQWTFIYS